MTNPTGQREEGKVMELRCKDSPDANGRIPVKGDQRFTLIFPTEDGSSLKLHMGKESMNHFETFIAQMMIDDHNEAEPGGRFGDGDCL